MADNADVQQGETANSTTPQLDVQRSSLLLCLKCRFTGHRVLDCPSPDWRPEKEWLLSRQRAQLDFSQAWSDPAASLCQRCQALDVLALLQEEPEWKSPDGLNTMAMKGSRLIQCLGQTGTIEYKSDCQLCLCLFALTPNPSNATQDVCVLPDWTIMRTAGENGVKLDRIEQQRYARCLLVTLSPSAIGLSVSINVHRGDALCVVDEAHKGELTLGGRAIHSHRLNLDVIHQWTNTCSKLHTSECASFWTEELRNIWLIDIDQRRVVAYPDKGTEYIALSYVWGPATQQTYKIGTILPQLPQTLEDAMACTKALGKRYLWVDLMCIDQTDRAKKLDQIQKMWSIYRGSWLTIIALSGDAAQCGLPSFGRSASFPQMTCVINGRRLVGLGPTLSYYIWNAPWGTRSWTLQEGMLAPRRLYMSDYQLYYECGALQCCESLDTSRSWAHNLTPKSNASQKGFTSWMMDQLGPGCLRSSANPLDNPDARLNSWGAKLTLYSYRRMTNDEDALHALFGILQRLQSLYTKGFFSGIPVEDLHWGLLWQSQGPPTRRPGFPTWSWAGWKCGIWPAYPLTLTFTDWIPVHLRMWKAQSGQLVPLLIREHAESYESAGAIVHLANDPLKHAAREDATGIGFEHHLSLQAEQHSYLMIEGIALTFTPNYTRPRTNTRQPGQYETFDFKVRDVQCVVRIISTDREIERARSGEKQDFLLLARDQVGDQLIHWLLQIEYNETGDTAVRRTVLSLYVPLGRLGVLEALQPRRRRVVLT